jgi:DNA-binding SARP family transcriptional activator
MRLSLRVKGSRMTQLELHFLGSPYLLLDGENVTLSHQKAVALLAYLTVTGQRQTRSALADLLWTEYEASEARLVCAA